MHQDFIYYIWPNTLVLIQVPQEIQGKPMLHVQSTSWSENFDDRNIKHVPSVHKVMSL